MGDRCFFFLAVLNYFLQTIHGNYLASLLIIFFYFFFFDKKLFFSFSFKKKIQNIHLQRNKSKVEEQFEVSVHLITTSYSKHNLYLIF